MNLIYFINRLTRNLRNHPMKDPEKAHFIMKQFFDTKEASLPLLASSKCDKEATLGGIIDIAEHFLVECDTACDCYVSKRLREILTKAGGHRIKSLKIDWPFYYKTFWDHTGKRGCNHCFYLLDDPPLRGCMLFRK